MKEFDKEYINSLELAAENGDEEALKRLLEGLHPADIAELVSQMDDVKCSMAVLSQGEMS